jgi:hypothetical protein
VSEWTEGVEWAEGVKEFWDESHRKGSPTRLGRTEAHEYSEYFSKVGPFPQDLAVAQVLLDVGPGLGAYLREHQGRERHAIDVSEVSRTRAEGLGATAHAPGEIGAVGADLATCLSVIQHCRPPAAELVFADVARALRKGGKFYVNGITGGHHSSVPARLVSAGRCSYTPEGAVAMAENAGFKVAGKHVYKLGSTGVWILYLLKL